MGDEVICYFLKNTSNDTVVCNDVKYIDSQDIETPEGLLPPTNGLFWMYLILYGVLVCFAG